MKTDVTFNRLLLDATDLLFQNDLNKARAKLNKALMRIPDEPRALSLLANILSIQHDHTASVEIYKKLLNNYPDEPVLHFKLGCEYLQMGDLKPGIDEIDKAILFDASNVQWKYFSDQINYLLGIFKTKPEANISLDNDLNELLKKVEQFIKSLPVEEEQFNSEELSTLTSDREDSQSGISINEFQVVDEKSDKDLSNSKVSNVQLENSENYSFISINLNSVKDLVFSQDILKFSINTDWNIREKVILASDIEKEAQPVFELFRGTVTDKIIENPKTGRLMKFQPQGTAILVPTKGKRFIGFTIQDLPLYIREDLVIAFQSHLKWENGWLRGEHTKIPMISFRGNGIVFIEIPDKLYSVELPETDFVTSPLDKLVGWDGYVVAQCLNDIMIQVAGTGHLMLKN